MNAEDVGRTMKVRRLVTGRLRAGPCVKKPYVLEKIALAVRDELDR